MAAAASTTGAPQCLKTPLAESKFSAEQKRAAERIASEIELEGLSRVAFMVGNGARDLTDLVAQLKCVFPEHSNDALFDALVQNGEDLEATAEYLLSSATPDESMEREQPPPKPEQQGRSKSQPVEQPGPLPEIPAGTSATAQPGKQPMQHHWQPGLQPSRSAGSHAATEQQRAAGSALLSMLQCNAEPHGRAPNCEESAKLATQQGRKAKQPQPPAQQQRQRRWQQQDHLEPPKLESESLDESVMYKYTTPLDESKLSAEQKRAAERIASEIELEQSHSWKDAWDKSQWQTERGDELESFIGPEKEDDKNDMNQETFGSAVVATKGDGKQPEKDKGKNRGKNKDKEKGKGQQNGSAPFVARGQTSSSSELPTKGDSKQSEKGTAKGRGKNKDKDRGKEEEHGRSHAVTRHERPPRSEDTRRQMKLKQGLHCTVKKHSSMGCAVVSMTDVGVRQAILAKCQDVFIDGIHVKLKPHTDKKTNEEVLTDIFCGWGGQVEKFTPLPEDSIADFFDKLQDEICVSWHKEKEKEKELEEQKEKERLMQMEEQKQKAQLQQPPVDPGASSAQAADQEQQRQAYVAHQQAVAHFAQQQRMMAYNPYLAAQQQQHAAYYAMQMGQQPQQPIAAQQQILAQQALQLQHAQQMMYAQHAAQQAAQLQFVAQQEQQAAQLQQPQPMQAAVEIEAQKKSELLVHYAKNGDVARMLRTLEEMEESGCTVTMASYATAVKVIARTGDSRTAHLWLLRAIEVGHIPTLDVFHVVINAYAKQRHLEKVENLVGLVQKAGLTLDTITYTIIIEACARVGDADAAQSWMRRMLDQKVQASVVTFGFLFLACANAGQIENLNKWFAMSQDAGIQCNWDCLNPVIKSLLFKNDDVVNASKWVMHMIETGRPPNTQLFIDVLNRSLEIDNADLTARIWQQMRATGVACDWPVYNQCILSAIKYQRKEFAQEWADESVARNIKITFAVRRIMTKADVKYRARADQFENLAAASPEDDIAVSDQKLGAPKGVEGRQVGPSQLSGEEARLACFGKDFTGVIKDFVPQKFGHIACDETFKIFGRDIFLAPSRNPEKLGKGQRVHFTVMPDGPTGHPRACDVRAWRPAKVQGTPTDQVGEI